LAFKRHLTGGSVVDVNSAAKVGRSLRAHSLKARWQLCKRVLDRPGDIDVFGDSSRANR
jgi:hypothetical protein